MKYWYLAVSMPLSGKQSMVLFGSVQKRMRSRRQLCWAIALEPNLRGLMSERARDLERTSLSPHFPDFSRLTDVGIRKAIR